VTIWLGCEFGAQAPRRAAVTSAGGKWNVVRARTPSSRRIGPGASSDSTAGPAAVASPIRAPENACSCVPRGTGRKKFIAGRRIDVGDEHVAGRS